MMAAWWGIIGVLLALAKAVIGLGGRGLQTLRGGLAPGEWATLVALVVLFVYVEGMRALQLRFAPHVVARAHALSADGPVIWRVLAPLYSFGLVGAPTRALLRAWAGVAAIVIAVIIVRALPEPWRGIIDLAVAAALLWGTVALAILAFRRLR